jgi:hypothetical protein
VPCYSSSNDENALLLLVCKLHHSGSFKCLNLSVNEQKFPSATFRKSLRRLNLSIQKWLEALQDGACNCFHNAYVPLRTISTLSIRLEGYSKIITSKYRPRISSPVTAGISLVN